jgi:hypothetical protein
VVGVWFRTSCARTLIDVMGSSGVIEPLRTGQHSVCRELEKTHGPFVGLLPQGPAQTWSSSPVGEFEIWSENVRSMLETQSL